MKNSRKKAGSALIVLGLTGALLLAGRQMQKDPEACRKDLFAMDTYFSMKAYGGSAKEALEAAEDKIRELERSFSVTAQGSDLWRINHGESDESGLAEARSYPVSEDTCRLAAAAIRMGDETEGALDISLYPVLREWGFTAGAYRVPSREEIEQILGNVNYRRIVCDGENRRICVPEGMELDFGAVAKGYAGDCVTDILREAGVTSAILDLGGNVQTLGAKPDGSCWKVGVKDPFDPGRELGIVEVKDKAVVTSGGYERYFTDEDGRIYWHILDPADGYPADSGLASVTVVGESGVACDGLSTALFVMGREKAIAHWRERQDFELILVTDGGELYITEGLAGCFESRSGWKAEVVLREIR